jgi:hypothetical protein
MVRSSNQTLTQPLRKRTSGHQLVSCHSGPPSTDLAVSRIERSTEMSHHRLPTRRPPLPTASAMHVQRRTSSVLFRRRIAAVYSPAAHRAHAPVEGARHVPPMRPRGHEPPAGRFVSVLVQLDLGWGMGRRPPTTHAGLLGRGARGGGALGAGGLGCEASARVTAGATARSAKSPVAPCVANPCRQGQEDRRVGQRVEQERPRERAERELRHARRGPGPSWA